MIQILPPKKDPLNQFLKGTAQVMPDIVEQYQKNQLLDRQRQQEQQIFGLQPQGQQSMQPSKDGQPTLPPDQQQAAEQGGIQRGSLEWYKKQSPQAKAYMAKKFPEYYRAYESELKRAEKPPPGGVSAQPVPEQYLEEINKIVTGMPDASSDELELAFQQSQVPKAHYSNYVESRRRQETDRSREKTKEKTEERKYHSERTKNIFEKAENLRKTLPAKEAALDLARDAIENLDPGMFTKDYIAERFNLPGLKTAKGAQLITAGKENLLNNMSRVSAKAQNIWFEKRLNSMFPEIGNSREANLSIQEMIEGELALDKAWLDTYDRLEQEDEEKYGYTRKDIGRRVANEMKDRQKQIFNRTTYRLKEIEEQENGLQALKNKVGKKVDKGTPLTLAMAKLYKDKYGDKAFDKAKQNGYTIPTLREFAMYREEPRSFRDVNEQ